MIVAQIHESTWLESLSGLPLWRPPSAPLLVIAPHPDDETLAAGGLIAAHRALGLDVTVIAVTDGENAYANAPGLAAMRRAEQTAALARLGVSPDKIIRLGVTDSSVSAHEDELLERILPFVTPDTQLIAPWRNDFHPDHEACGRAAEELARRTGANLTSWLFWTWHRGTPDLLRDFPLRMFPLTADQLQAKSEALLCHASQLHRPTGDAILPEDLLAPAHRPFEVFIA